MRHHQAGDLKKAAGLYEQARKLDPNNPDLLHLLGVVTHQLGRSRRAVQYLEKAVALRPDAADFHGNLANVLAAMGRFDAAVAHYRRALTLRPDFAEAHNNLANALHDHGRLEEAVDHYRRALALRPDSARIHNNLGVALKDLGRMDEAEAALAKAVTLEPDYADAHNNLGNLWRDRGRLEEAAAFYERALALRPGVVGVHNNLGDALRRLGRLEDALAHFHKALEIDPDVADTHVNLANALREQGRLDEARESCRRALSLAPDSIAAYYSLAKLDPPQRGDPAFARLEGLRDAPSLRPDDDITLEFTLGEMYANLGNTDAAFDAFRRGNVLRRRKAERLGRAFDAAGHRRFVSRIIETFTAGFFAARPESGDPSQAPVFIVGMPRSGTTLIEQILASHPQVHGAGEVPFLSRAADGLPAPYPEGAAALETEGAKALAGQYLARLGEGAGEARRITDKTPDNFLLLGLAALLLPGARVIDCRRDPRDTCLSCYFNNFVSGQHFTDDLADLAAYYREYRRLMAHWHAVLPLPILEVAYEDLVADQEAVSRRIVGFCGLEWDPRCLEFHRTRRPVRTASNVQVRKRIFTTSVRRWRAFEKHLGPLLAALDDEAAARPAQSRSTEGVNT